MKDAIRVLAVCSGGGHWIQMKRLSPAFKGCDLTVATVDAVSCDPDTNATMVRIPDANKDTKFRLAFLLAKLAWIILHVRPHVIVSTGAAPGYLAIRLGRLIGARTLFVDSIANAEVLSLSAKMAIPYADVTLSQWENVAIEQGANYWGAVL